LQHLATFKEFPVRQVGLSADVGTYLQGVRAQILRAARESGAPQ